MSVGFLYVQYVFLHVHGFLCHTTGHLTVRFQNFMNTYKQE